MKMNSVQHAHLDCKLWMEANHVKLVLRNTQTLNALNVMPLLALSAQLAIILMVTKFVKHAQVSI